MRNDSHKWSPAQAITSFVDTPIDLNVAVITPIELARQTLISGANVLSQINAPLIGWPDITSTESYALCLRRDRVLIVDEVSTNDSNRDTGWDDASQQALSDVSDSYAVFDLSGPQALELLQRGAEISLQTQSRSVMRLLFGLDTMIYRVASTDRFRIHIAWARQQSLIEHLQMCSRAAESFDLRTL